MFQRRDLSVLQKADGRTARYARLHSISTRRRKLAPVDTRLLAHQLEEAAPHSVYQHYTVVYHSQELNSLTASKTHPTETLRTHLLGVANWVLYLVRTRVGTSRPSLNTSTAAAVLAGDLGVTPGPVRLNQKAELSDRLALGSCEIDTIKRLYEARWQIEILFRVIKQAFGLKTERPIGRSLNAVLVQIYCAVITY